MQPLRECVRAFAELSISQSLLPANVRQMLGRLADSPGNPIQ